LVRIVRFWVETFATPFIVETPNFFVWIRAFVLLLLVVDHGFRDDWFQPFELVACEAEAIHNVLFVFVRWELSANHVVNPRHFRTDWQTLTCWRLRGAIRNVGVVQTPLLIFDNNDHVTVAILAFHLEIDALVNGLFCGRYWFEHGAIFKSLDQCIQFEMEHTRSQCGIVHSLLAR
jgi:hypothetical protein